ncbi:ABC transporter permease [Haloferax sp. DFSO52]|uniref:ABC transporter permease n=1 Tax=Haloferax sp. DFSO52 TaxID=3388505 RepID=UPI003A8B4BEB
MSGALAVASRILLTLRGDRRTLGLVLVVPVVIIYLLNEVFERPTEVAPVLLAVFVFMLTYILTAIGFLRERQAGTFERVLVSPISRLELVLGYVLGYGLLATALSLVLLGSSIYFFDLEFEHGIALFFLVEWLGALTALAIGILLSLFAQNEFQVMQFIPLVITPQVILGGTFVPVEELPFFLELLARAMPLTYLIQGMNFVVLDEGTTRDLWVAIVALLFFTELSAIAANEVIRRVR